MRALQAFVRLLRFMPTGQSLLIGGAWAVFWAVAWGRGGFGFLEEPLGDVLWRASQSQEPTQAAWIVFTDKASGERGHSPSDASTWRRVLERAREEGVSGVVVLDPAARDGLAEALKSGPVGVRVIVPSRRHDDPFLEAPPVIEPFFPPELGVPADRYVEGLLDLRPDEDGTWRRSDLRDAGGRPTLLGLLAPAGLLAAGELRHTLSGRAGVESRISLWRIATKDLTGQWGGGTWIVAPEAAPRDVWSSEGERLPEARAVAQVVDGMKRGRWYTEAPAWGVGLLLLALFLGAWSAAVKMAPIRGLAVVGVACAAVVGAAWALRAGALWFLPIVPLVPTAAAGYLCGLAERHRLLRRGMAELLLRLGRSRVLNPILSRPTSDEHDVGAFRALLDLDAAAVLTDDPDRPLVALATREDRADLWDWFTPGARTLVGELQSRRERPLFYVAPDIGPKVILENIARRNGRSTWLAIVARGDPEAWWQDNRAMVLKAMVPLGSIGPAAPRPEGQMPVEQIAVPENQLKVLRSTVDQTELERTFLLGFLDRLSEGVLVCDLVGRALIYNKRFQKMAEELGVDLENPMIAFLKTISSHTDEQVWQSISQALRSGARWTLYASVQKHPVRHYMSNLVRLELGGGESGGGVQGASDVIALVVTEVSDLYEAERLKSELLEHFVHDVRNAVTIIAQSAEEVSEIVSDESVKPDLEMIRDQAMGIAERFKRMSSLAGISAEKIADELTPSDLVAEAKRAMSAAAAMAEQLGIILAYDGQTVVPFAVVRPSSLRAALLMVIEQALASSPRGSTVTIGAQDEGQEVVVKVNDPGWSPMFAISRMRSAIPTGTTMKYAAEDGLQKSVGEAGGRIAMDFDEAVGTSVKLAFPKVSNRLEGGESAAG
ncbi:MAG: HAMP domain-containing histidine kinase [Planctomycetes bacterium]|nr:HAMP domain-containing histidine kinase [Planctomycetota bacterium]